MQRVLILIAWVASLGPALATAAEPAASQPNPSQPAFASASPESVGLSTAALEALDAVVRGYVERAETVGAELMVLQDRKVVWHRAHGFADREKKAPLEPGSIYCIRSMTKTFVGTAIQMLLDEGRLTLDDWAAKFLPAFDNPTHAAITIQHLLEHRSGLPLSSLLKTDLRSLKSVQDVAELAGKSELHFTPGADFNYSDDGTDALTAIIEKVSGQPAEEFILARIIGPLGMSDTIPVLQPDDPRRARQIPAYAGSTGSWTRFWSPEEPALFAYFLGSQGMYSTCADYARLLCLWADGGEAGGKRLLSKAAIERGLSPRSSMGSAISLPGLESRYAQMWQVWTRGAASNDVVAFGHGGSDGTMAWMWPKRDLIVLYYTQSRGGMSSLALGREIDRILFRGELVEKNVNGPADLDRLSGVYWNDAKKRYWAFWPAADGKKLRVEIQGRSVIDLVPSSQPSVWQAEQNPALKAKFADDSAGPPATIQVGNDREQTSLTRIEVSGELPSIDAVVQRVCAAHRVDRLKGVIRSEGVLELAGTRMPYVEYLSADAGRMDLDAPGGKTISLCRGDRVWMKRGDAAAEELTGELAAETLFAQSYVSFGDWRKFSGATAAVLRREALDGKPHLLVRIAPRNGLPLALWIDESSGRVTRAQRVVNIPGIGVLGVDVQFLDFEEVGGALLPRRTTAEYVAVLGKGESRVEKIEVIEPRDDLFDPNLK